MNPYYPKADSMGIAGSIVDTNFFQEYWVMRNESVDMSEIIRRANEGIYDNDEFAKAMEWTKKYCKPNKGTDFNIPEKIKNEKQRMLITGLVLIMGLFTNKMQFGYNLTITNNKQEMIFQTVTRLILLLSVSFSGFLNSTILPLSLL